MKIDDEDKALRLILSFIFSYEYMKSILMYIKEALNFSEVSEKLMLEEKSLTSEGRTSYEDLAMITSNFKKKNDYMQKTCCWKCGQSRHLRRNCVNREGLAKGSRSDADNVSLVQGGGDFLLRLTKSIIMVFMFFAMIEHVMLAVSRVWDIGFGGYQDMCGGSYVDG